jgi:arsenite oxidase small subunit
MVAVGILAFPPGLAEVVHVAAPGTVRITRTYPRLRIARLTDLAEGQPLDFRYPLQEHQNFLVKLGTPAWDGVGPDKDVVAFNYFCSHMGCPLNGQYKHEHKMLGPCPCHFSRFDLAKNGTLILGQATQSLPQVLLEVEKGEIYAVAVSGLVYGYRDNLEDGTPSARKES